MAQQRYIPALKKDREVRHFGSAYAPNTRKSFLYTRISEGHTMPYVYIDFGPGQKLVCLAFRRRTCICSGREAKRIAAMRNEATSLTVRK